MATLMHHDHTIVSTPVFDDDNGRWKLSASVTWPQIGAPRGARFFTSSPELFIRFEDAERAGVEAAKNWVEHHYKKALI
jgi:hypothetical protein